MTYETIVVRHRGTICFIQFNRPSANNAINSVLVSEMTEVIRTFGSTSTVFVLEGLPEVFCIGADFSEVESLASSGAYTVALPEALYDLWYALATGPFVSVAHVKGKAGAGGLGFVAACDIVIAAENSFFSLPEMLFGLMPACVFPFLINRMSPQKVHLLALLTQPMSARDALAIGLVDAVGADSDDMLRRHLLRLRMLRKVSIERYKRFSAKLMPHLERSKVAALEANERVFNDPENLEMIAHFRRTGEILPQESSS